ncbi:hypothetical protein BH23ACT3_BH23ACT3_12890 [soil metagenome]
MTDDHDDVSEQLDPDVLGDATGDEDLPHTIDYPPDEPLGVEDPTLTGSDDVASREDRTQSGNGFDEEVPVPIDPDPAGIDDHDPEVWADDETASADEVSAEEAAMHIEEPPV